MLSENDSDFFMFDTLWTFKNFYVENLGSIIRLFLLILKSYVKLCKSGLNNHQKNYLSHI